MRVAEALDGDGALRHAVLDQLGLHRLGTAHREALIVLLCARCIGVAIRLDARVLHVRRVVRCLLDDLPRTIVQCRLVPINRGLLRRKVARRCSSPRPRTAALRAVQRSRLGLGESEMPHADANRCRVAA
jgi:hypothetical protein